MKAAGATPVLRATGLSKSYPGRQGESAPIALFRNLHLVVNAGEMVAITGRSGAGKSSLLHLLAGLETPSAGEVWLGNDALHTLSPEQLATTRNRRIGYVWQFHYLLPEFSALENVALPLIAGRISRRAALTTAANWLNRVGLSKRAEHRPGELSGGEQQRVAIARALAANPDVLLADEPTGDLDNSTAAELFRLLHELCRQEQLAAVLVTHNDDLAAQCDRSLELVDGTLQPLAM